MAALLLDRVIETTNTTGTGSVTLLGAQTGNQAFRDEAPDGATVYYLIVDNPASPSDWEYGIGTLTYGVSDTLSRDTVIDSSASGSKISIASGPAYTVRSPVGKDAIQPGSLTKTGAYTLSMADVGRHVACDASGGDFTVTLPPAATATGRYSAVISNTGASGTVTLDPDGSETIGGASTRTIGPGQALLIRCDGSEWAAMGAGTLGSVDEDILPDTDSTRDVGNASKAFAEGHFDKTLTDTLEDRSTGDSLGAEYLVNGTPTTWAALNGTGTIALRSDMNVASVTDGGAGVYTFNFTSAYAAADYAATTGGRFSGTDAPANAVRGVSSAIPNTGSLLVVVQIGNGGVAYDFDWVNIHVTGALA